jgi:hypothetical protein
VATERCFDIGRLPFAELGVSTVSQYIVCQSTMFGRLWAITKAVALPNRLLEPTLTCIDKEFDLITEVAMVEASDYDTVGGHSSIASPMSPRATALRSTVPTRR